MPGTDTSGLVTDDCSTCLSQTDSLHIFPCQVFHAQFLVSALSNAEVAHWTRSHLCSTVAAEVGRGRISRRSAVLAWTTRVQGSARINKHTPVDQSVNQGTPAPRVHRCRSKAGVLVSRSTAPGCTLSTMVAQSRHGIAASPPLETRLRLRVSIGAR